MTYPETPFESDEPPIEPRPVLPSGIEAGLVAGFTVIAVFLISDMWSGEFLRTPSVLGTLLIDGVESARAVRSAPGAAAAYNFIHFAAWILAGSIGIQLMHRVEKSAAAWYLPWIALALLLLGCAALDVAVLETGLGRLHLWLGGLAGTLALAIFMGWRHPHAMTRVLRLGRDPT
jgi:hypothetical protein